MFPINMPNIIQHVSDNLAENPRPACNQAIKFSKIEEIMLLKLPKVCNYWVLNINMYIKRDIEEEILRWMLPKK